MPKWHRENEFENLKQEHKTRAEALRRAEAAAEEERRARLAAEEAASRLKQELAFAEER